MGPDPLRHSATFSDLSLLPLDADKREAGGGLYAVRCPSRPDYADGHCVHVACEGAGFDLDAAVELWADHVAADTNLEHARLMIEGEPSVLDAAPSEGWTVERRAVMKREPGAVAPPAPDPDTRPCRSVEDWDAVVWLLASALPQSGPSFVTWRAEQLRHLSSRFEGSMWLRRKAGRAVACAGGFRVGPVWRFQEVICHPDRQRQGHARAVCAQVAAAAGPDPAIVVAERDSPAQRLYESLGFSAAAEQHVWWTQIPRHG